MAANLSRSSNSWFSLVRTCPVRIRSNKSHMVSECVIMAPFLGILTEYCLVPPPGIEPGQSWCEKVNGIGFHDCAPMPETKILLHNAWQRLWGQRQCLPDVVSERMASITQPAKLVRTQRTSSPMMMASVRVRPVT